MRYFIQGGGGGNRAAERVSLFNLVGLLERL